MRAGLAAAAGAVAAAAAPPAAAPAGVVVAAYQGRCSGNVTANFATVEEVVREQGAAGTDFLVFPEAFLTDYLCADCAMEVGDPRLAALVAHAARWDMVVAVGFAQRNASTGAVLNSVLVAHRGAVLGTYSKIMLTGDCDAHGENCTGDREWYIAGDRLPVFRADVKGKGEITFAVQICADSTYPEVALTYRWLGARLILSPHYNSIPYDSMDAHRVLVRNNHVGASALMAAVVARSNVVGGGAEVLGYGDATVFHNDGSVAAACPLFRDRCVARAELDPREFRSYDWGRAPGNVPEVVRGALARAVAGV